MSMLMVVHAIQVPDPLGSGGQLGPRTEEAKILRRLRVGMRLYYGEQGRKLNGEAGVKPDGAQVEHRDVIFPRSVADGIQRGTLDWPRYHHQLVQREKSRVWQELSDRLWGY